MIGQELLTDDEHKALELTGELSKLLRKIIQDGAPDKAIAGFDWNEAALRIHSVQHLILAQAAARAYPDKYRLLGTVIPKK